MTDEPEAPPFKELEPLKDAPLAPAHAIAALALNMALKYHDIATIQDGTLYNAYKLEGRNIREIHLDYVLQTAEKIEAWLLQSSDRIAQMLIDAIEVEVEDDKPKEPPPDAGASDAQ